MQVSVRMPAFNAERYISEAIESVLLKPTRILNSSSSMMDLLTIPFQLLNLMLIRIEGSR